MSIEQDEQFLEILAMLDPSGGEFIPTSRSTCTKFTAADLSAALAGVGDIGLMGLMRRYRQVTEQDEGFYRLYAKLIDTSRKWDWKRREKAIGNGLVRKFLQVALIDYYIPHKCKRCGGTGREHDSADGVVTRPCRACDGKRFTRRPNTERARVMRISPTEYDRTWNKRLPMVIDFLHDVMPNEEANARNKMRRNLQAGESVKNVPDGHRTASF